MAKAKDIAAKAAKLVGGDRAKAYQDPLDGYAKVAAVWNGILAAAGKAGAEPIDAHDAATMMEGLKIARRYIGPHNQDNYIDAAGYAAVAGEIADRS